MHFAPGIRRSPVRPGQNWDVETQTREPRSRECPENGERIVARHVSQLFQKNQGVSQTMAMPAKPGEPD